jgi:hypothetical protein
VGANHRIDGDGGIGLETPKCSFPQEPVSMPPPGRDQKVQIPSNRRRSKHTSDAIAPLHHGTERGIRGPSAYVTIAANCTNTFWYGPIVRWVNNSITIPTYQGFGSQNVNVSSSAIKITGGPPDEIFTALAKVALPPSDCAHCWSASMDGKCTSATR